MTAQLLAWLGLYSNCQYTRKLAWPVVNADNHERN